jgi:uncharacterized protein YgbK (DUF1537 family)
MISDYPVVINAMADDLSGAAEVASLLTTRGSTLVLSGPARGTVCVTDLDVRHRPAAEVSARVRAAVAGAPGARVLVKIDSLLRGPVSALVGAVGPVVVAPALPALDRVVTAGVVTAGGRGLAETPAWAAEHRSAPGSVAEALSPLRTTVIPLATVRSADLPEALRGSVAAGTVPICDATTDTDLDAIVAATPEGVALAGSGGVAAALGRAVRLPHTRAAAVPAGVGGWPLVVVGTAEVVAREQVRRLIVAGATEVLLPADERPVTGATETTDHTQVTAALRRGPVVLRPVPGSPADRVRAHAVCAALAVLAARVVAGTTTPLVLTGGETARRVLDALGVRTLHPIDSVHHGAVRSRADDGRLVVTRPGSFGAPDSLVSIVAASRGGPHPTEGV